MTAAAFQTSVAFQSGLGVIGDLFDSGPRRSQPFILNSALSSYNVFGRGFSITSQGVAAAGNSGGTAVFAGILVNPKTQASFGDGTDPLNPTLQLPNYTQAELLTQGSIIVYLPAAANIGDWVYYDQTTGILGTVAPAASLPSGKSWAYAYVDRFTVAAAGLAVITLNNYALRNQA